MGYGKKVWIFPDAELPPVGVNLIPGHESIIITNTCDEEAKIKITLFFPDKEPISFCTEVAARRVRCLRTNEEKDFGEFTAKFEEQYAIMLESSVPVVAQCGGFGFNIEAGDNFFANNNSVFVDPGKITIGNNVFIAPNCGFYTAITVGDDVWFGGNTVVLPGVTIGSNVVIGAGSVVTKDIPDNCVAYGNPCRVIRPITEEDKKYHKE